jgi:pentafunctional AROM polypeptide
MTTPPHYTHEFYLFGSPILHSLSPTIHNTGFLLTGHSSSHHYHLHTATSTTSLDPVLSSITFRGASVTIPLKTKVIGLCDWVSEEARGIGAVNTVVRGEGGLRGDNTDWLGIERPLDAVMQGGETAHNTHDSSNSNNNTHTPTDRVSRGSSVMLVLGAGGTARAAVLAARKLGLAGVVVANRTEENARAMCEELQGSLRFPCEVYRGPAAHGRIACVVSTLPITAERPISDADLDAILATAPAVLDVVYRPRTTPLLERAKTFGCKTVEGVEMLVAQAIEQFKRFLPEVQSPPAAEMRKAALDAYDRA